MNFHRCVLVFFVFFLGCQSGVFAAGKTVSLKAKILYTYRGGGGVLFDDVAGALAHANSIVSSLDYQVTLKNPIPLTSSLYGAPFVNGKPREILLEKTVCYPGRDCVEYSHSDTFEMIDAVTICPQHPDAFDMKIHAISAVEELHACVYTYRDYEEAESNGCRASNYPLLVGNPVAPVTGEKVQVESDFGSSSFRVELDNENPS